MALSNISRSQVLDQYVVGMADLVSPEMKPREATISSEEAEAKKKLGNEAFVAKNFDEALKFYSEAIALDSNNAVYYSNRSACHASKRSWKESLADAKECITRDPKFMKGYYRLSVAQMELGLFDDAASTVQSALQVEPENEQMMRQSRLIRNKRNEAMNAKSGAGGQVRKQLSESAQKEFETLRDEGTVYHRDLRGVNNHLSVVARDTRATQVTQAQVAMCDDTTNLYKSVGKAYIWASKQDVEETLKKDAISLKKTENDLNDRKQYLERRIQSNQANIKDLIGSG